MSKKDALASYIEVKDRVAEFRAEYPHYTIDTDIVELNDDMCVMKCCIFDETNRLISTGHAREKLNDNAMVNRTSLVENCETSCVGRALAFMGYKISRSIASADEMRKVDNSYTATPQQKQTLTRIYNMLGVTDKDTAIRVQQMLIDEKIQADESSLISFVKQHI